MKRATTQQTSGPNVVIMGIDLQFGLGFMVSSSVINHSGPNSFGHFGAGGSMGWADPDADLAFGYVMNKMAMGLAGDPARRAWSRPATTRSSDHAGGWSAIPTNGFVNRNPRAS